MERVLLSGAWGLIGAALFSSLEQGGAEVVQLARGSPGKGGHISWDPMAEAAGTGILPPAVSGFDAVIHLAGESIVGRWTEEKKKAIRESRGRGRRNLATALARTE